MIIGNVKAALEPEVGTLGLSTPTVIYGEDFVARSLPVSERTVVPLLCEGERFDVIVELRPNTGAGRSAAMATVGGNHTAR